MSPTTFRAFRRWDPRRQRSSSRVIIRWTGSMRIWMRSHARDFMTICSRTRSRRGCRCSLRPSRPMPMWSWTPGRRESVISTRRRPFRSIPSWALRIFWDDSPRRRRRPRQVSDTEEKKRRRRPRSLCRRSAPGRRQRERTCPGPRRCRFTIRVPWGSRESCGPSPFA